MKKERFLALSTAHRGGGGGDAVPKYTILPHQSPSVIHSGKFLTVSSLGVIVIAFCLGKT